LAQLTGEPLSTIDHWADMGLLEFRKWGHRRLFDPALNADRCREIRAMQQSGMTLTMIRDRVNGLPSRD
jgi:DNA-binding transcriptional MerR regulator